MATLSALSFLKPINLAIEMGKINNLMLKLMDTAVYSCSFVYGS